MPTYFAKPQAAKLQAGHSLSPGLILALPLGKQGGTTEGDASGRIPLGCPLSGTFTFTTGAYGRCPKFDGSTSYGVVTAAGTPLNNWVALTLGIIFRITATPPQFCRLLEKGANSEITLAVNAAGGNSKLTLQQLGGTTASVTTTANLFDGNTHAALVTITPAFVATLYVDGTVIGTTSSGTPAKSGDLNLAQYSASQGALNFPGLIEGVFAWNYALGTTEAETWFADPFGMLRRRQVVPTYASLVAPTNTTKARRTLSLRTGSRGVA